MTVPIDVERLFDKFHFMTNNGFSENQYRKEYL